MTNCPAIAEIADEVKSGKRSALELVELSIRNIDELEDYKSLISDLRDRALSMAKDIDKKVADGEKLGRLAGVPFIAKDNFLINGGETTAASNILKNFSAPYTATAIKKLEAEGAICIAKANLDAFAHGSSTENSDFFTTKNPIVKTRVPGGSSGGSAAAVALNITPFALGSDTGGSVRLPASYCGVVGYKPTYGLISRSGVVAMASSLDVVGPITNSVEDAALLLDVMAGKDGLDSTLIDRQESYVDLSDDIKGKKFGIVKEYFGDGLTDEVRKSVESAIEKIKQAGGIVEEVSLPSLPLALAVYYIICPAEVSSNLGRYDGQRYGYSSEKATNLDDSYELSRSEGFGPEAKRRIMIGTHVLSSGYYDAYYKKAQTVRTKIINEYKKTFESFDFLIGPTASTVAFKIGEKSSDPLSMYLTDVLTVAANIAGIPAISIPCGNDDDSLPIGLQIMAPLNDDKNLLSVSSKILELLV